MNSSPVLLLQPTAPISMSMGSMNLTAIDTRTTMLASSVSPTMSNPKLDGTINKNATDYNVTESPACAAMRSMAPVTPDGTSAHNSVSLGAASPSTTCSPRDPSAKVATQFVATTKVPPSANATAIVDAPSAVPTNAVHTSLNSSSTCPPHVAHSISHLPLHATPLMIPPHAGPTTPTSAKRASSSSAPSPAPVTKSSSPKPVKSNTGRWTEVEHKLFLKGLEQFPYRAWKKIATLIKTRSVVQIRTHAQKYYQKMEKEEQRNRERENQASAQRSPHSNGSTPTTPSRHMTLEAKHPTVNTTSSIADDLIEEESDVDDSFSHNSKHTSYKRKFSGDEDLFPQSSLPKRMVKEKQCMREKTMSPKQKMATANSKLFGHVLCDDFGIDPLSTLPNNRAAVSAPPARNLDTIKSEPLCLLEEESTDTNMLLAFADVKPLDYPFSLESSLDQGLAGMDSDELLQLTDDESMEWFTNEDKEDGPSEGETGKTSPVSSPLNLGRHPFAPLYSQDSLQFVDPGRSINSTSECTTPSPILTSATDCSDFGLNTDDDEDFVLDPEKFLSSYFSPDASHLYS